MFQQVKLFKPGALTPSSMHSEVPGALTPSGWESVVENKPDRFAMDTPCATGTSIPATPLWTEAQMEKSAMEDCIPRRTVGTIAA